MIKFGGIIIIIFFFAFVVWYSFPFAFFKNIQVQGTAAPVLSKNQAIQLMHYHGVKVVYVKDGEWFFRRDDKDCKLTRKK